MVVLHRGGDQGDRGGSEDPYSNPEPDGQAHRQQRLTAPSGNRAPERRSVLTQQSWQAYAWERNLLPHSPR